MREREQGRGYGYGGGSGGQQAQEAQKEEVLQEKLLEEGPDGVAPVALEEDAGACELLQGVKLGGDGDGDGCEGEGGGDDPEGTEGV